ncbi:dna polymerase iii subunit delta [Diplodia corticola]|uniref:Dna polymerase iii subunit delta n=1 Tax=Diplodia corticola TaxID=236234 RepID=A0A1J9S5B7_9PEZI|nr:dna polymerase iii subunit delta [Diplodia corticola]OJD34813.1 dna polymerase iii subunit delta [Diplodia corticola]
MPVTLSVPTLSLSAAQAAARACEAKAKEIGVPMNIAVVDSGLHLLQFSRMDGAKLTSIDIAISKAFTASGHRVPTSAYKDAVWPGGVAFGINNSNGGKFTTIGGGVPVKGPNGEILGAIGCSTGTPAQDEQVAKAGIEALEKMVKDEGKLKAKL